MHERAAEIQAVGARHCVLREARRPETLTEMALEWPVREFVLVESAVGAYRVIGRWNLAAI